MKATLKLFNQARSKVSTANLGYYVPGDPGFCEYMAVFGTIIESGSQTFDWVLPGFEYTIQDTFAFSETISLTRWGRLKSDEERWFRILTTLCELVLWFESGYGLRDRSLDSVAITLFHDLMILDIEADFVPVFEEILALQKRPKDELSGLLILIMLETQASEREKYCRRLWEVHDLCEPFLVPGSDHEKNRNFGDTQHFVWGLLYDETHLADWVFWVDKRFPNAPGLLAETREHLLVYGERWKNGRRQIVEHE